MTCPICGRADAFEDIVTYKSVWFWCHACGGMSRRQRDAYPLEWLSRVLTPVLKNSRKGRAGLALVGRKQVGADFYRYYEDIIDRGERGKWAGQYRRLVAQLGELGISLRGRRLIDISGEPGVFAKDAAADCTGGVVVTAYANNVVEALKRAGCDALQYDFNQHSLVSRLGDRKFDLVCARWNMGFCEDLGAFFGQAYSVLDPGGVFVVSHSPASRAICSRWMFDDYTYLRAYSSPWVRLRGMQAGFSLAGSFDEGSFPFSHELPLPARLLIDVYRWLLEPKLRIGGSYHRSQHNETIVFVKH